MNGEKCSGCHFWLEIHDERGNCRRKPPVVLWNEDDSEAVTEWPVVFASQWCGEYKRVFCR